MAKHYKNQNKIIQIRSANGKRYQTSKKPAKRSTKQSGSRFASSGFSEKTDEVKNSLVSVVAKVKDAVGSKLKTIGKSKDQYRPKYGQAKEPISFDQFNRNDTAAPKDEPKRAYGQSKPVAAGKSKDEPKSAYGQSKPVVAGKSKDEPKSAYGQSKPVAAEKPKNEPKKAYGQSKFVAAEKPKKEKRQRKKKVNPLALPENLPSTEQLETELSRERNQKANSRLVRNTIFALITVAATAVLVATLFLPILQIYGTSMTPTLSEGEIVVSIKGSAVERGDIISFYYNNKILVKRVIAFEGEYVNIDDDGTVLINNKRIEEPYITEKSFGECDLKLPYQVPAGKIFVLGDHRATSVDSRSSVMGCVAEEQIVGKIVFRVWPLDQMGEIN